LSEFLYVFTDNSLEKAFKYAKKLYEENRNFIIESDTNIIAVFLTDEEYNKYSEILRKYAEYRGKNKLNEHVFWLRLGEVILYEDVEWNYDTFNFKKAYVFCKKSISKDVIEIVKKIRKVHGLDFNFVFE